MSLLPIIENLSNSLITKELINRMSRDQRLTLSGGGMSAKIFLASSISLHQQNPLLIVVSTLEEASRWNALFQGIGCQTVHLYPTSEISPYEQNDPTSEILWGQIQVITDLINPRDRNFVIITTERALQPHLPPKSEFVKQCILLEKGIEINSSTISTQLTSIGYKKTNTTDQEGHWSRRGDIIDIYPVSNEFPIRIELYGDEIDKIREFDPVSQRSLDTINKICIPPTNLSYLIRNKLRDTDNVESDRFFSQAYKDSLSLDNLPKYIRILLGFAWEKPSCLLDYLPENTIVLVDERNHCFTHSQVWVEHVNDTYNSLIAPVESNLQLDISNINNNLQRSAALNFASLDTYIGYETTNFINEYSSNNKFEIAAKKIEVMANQFGRIAQFINTFLTQKYSIYILSAQPSRTIALLEEHDCHVFQFNKTKDINASFDNHKLLAPTVIKCPSSLELEGINFAPWKILILTDKEIFGQQFLGYSGYVRRRKSAVSKSIKASRLTKGDFVVHRNHGIGKFIKIEKFAMNNVSRDYLVVEYQDGTLRVAADQLGSLSRYRASTDKSPKVNKLGGSSWNSITQKARKAISKVAVDLVKLYAEREKVKGYKFPSDGPWQGELEDSFQYEPTPDQIKAVSDVKTDMERPKPMDRLICGDVGYGKTEVAIRAAFKAIIAGKQVALLAPTTILSQQHWRTITERFAPYPIKIGLLNRFKTNNERKNIIKELECGQLDAIVGTHQLLGKTVKFKDLGLLIIDEEQRFGVRQKERIKELKTNVDVLTLTATPIPRTLYMSLSGVREISLITTPPPLRRAIKTHLIPYEKEAIRSAICQEIDRGGQIFYVVPRVEGIQDIVKELKSMVPNINLLIAHGQMDEGDLENSMIAFNNGEADLMLCTTIIESGLDIPRVNTIIIEDSHSFGLSQLYQLRGRVGRSGVQAHAWLLYPKEVLINQKAIRRLKAIQEFSELGSGYQLAMRDMEIRGVGNLIGMQQSGQMEAIGFEMYMEILHEAISDIQGQTIPKVDETKIDLQVTAFIPNSWISDSEEKIIAYKAVTDCETSNKLIELSLNWSDKYGSLPAPVITLIEVMQLKLLAKSCGISCIKLVKPNILLETKMEKSAFKLLLNGIPSNLHTRFIYKKGSNINEVVVRGLGLQATEKQISELKDWFMKMKNEIGKFD
ncbi:transcription-repair coupling factor [Prochlorococcus marinus]|uniref:transcription-repair coupling factor n=1 Tax=Prochlorococcus marinus TaxID=1219 RepID=UPI0022B4DA87|nr:transcription-repair coupling factor [Prochlorococcus marinus]